MPIDAPAHSPQSLLIREAAQLLGVSRRTIYYRIREGRLLTIRTRGGSQRVLRASLDELRLEPARTIAIAASSRRLSADRG